MKFYDGDVTSKLFL